MGACVGFKGIGVAGLSVVYVGGIDECVGTDGGATVSPQPARSKPNATSRMYLFMVYPTFSKNALFREAHEPAIKLLRYKLLLFLRLDALVVAPPRGLSIKPCKQALKLCHVLLGVCAILVLVGKQCAEISECRADIVKFQTPCQHRV